MRIHGWCTSCHRVKVVRVTSSGMVRLATRQVAEGVCADCEEREDNERKARRRR